MKKYALLVAVFAAMAACGDDDTLPVTTSSPDAGTDATAVVEAGTDAANGIDSSAPEAGAVAPSGSLTITANASSTMPAGTFTPTSGSAQLRGGVLTIALADADKAIELTLYDDAAPFDANESFQADAPGSFGLHKARVETYRNDTGWVSDGDGSVVVTAISAASVTLELKGFAQNGPGIVPDVFTLAGTVTAPITTLVDRAGTATSFAISNVLPEPISNDPNNLTGPTTAIASASPVLGERPVPFSNPRRGLDVVDTVGATKRTLRIAFPSGHYPRAGQDLTLSKFERITVGLFEGDDPSTKLWEADQGSAEVTARSDTSITLKLTGARMQSESPAAKGLFNLDGTVTFSIP